MKPELQRALEQNYNIRLAEVSDGPKGQVATETYVLRDDKGQRYFCKFISRPDFMRIVLPTLPVLREMKDKGIARIAAPLPAKDGLSVMAGGVMIVLLDYLDAQQGYNYDLAAFGRLLGDIHALTPKLAAKLPVTGFSSFREMFFREELPRLMTGKPADAPVEALQALLRLYAADTQACIDAFFRLSRSCAARPCEFVNTHGDVLGNVLVKSPQDFYLIDWDEMELAPPERDLWKLAEKPEFMAGYRAARPGFQIDDEALNHAVLKNYLEGIPIYLTPILDPQNRMEARLAQVKKLEEKRLNGWMKPIIRDILAQAA
jgi:spectinomycin phosphotransferase